MCLELPVDCPLGLVTSTALSLPFPPQRTIFNAVMASATFGDHLEEIKGKAVGRPHYPQLAKRRSVEEGAKPTEKHKVIMAL